MPVDNYSTVDYATLEPSGLQLPLVHLVNSGTTTVLPLTTLGRHKTLYLIKQICKVLCFY